MLNIRKLRDSYQAVALAGFCLLASAAFAKDKHAKPAPEPPQDQIEVVAHLPLTGSPIKRFLTTQHYSDTYLYAEHATGNTTTLIDVTGGKSATVLAELPESNSLAAVTGTAALSVSEPSNNTAPLPAPQTVRIMSFADPKHPKVMREFTGVTAMQQDSRRGLIFLANTDGIWILHQTFAEDPEIEKAYAHHVVYDH